MLFGTTGTILVNAPEEADAWSVGCLRLLIGGVTLLAVARGRLVLARSSLLGAAGVAVFQLGYFLAVERTGVAVGTVVTIGSGPVLTGLIEAVRSRRLPGTTWMLGTGLCIAGVALLGLAGRSGSADGLGVLLGVSAGLGWATFSTVAKHQIDHGADSTASLATLFVGGALLLSPVLLWHAPGWLMSSRGAMVALALGLATVGLAYTLYGWALRHLPTSTVITLTLLEPITASLLAAVVVHEGIRGAGWLGIGLVLAGLVVTARDATTTVAA
jgi:DME family drug/metabolite transporter